MNSNTIFAKNIMMIQFDKYLTTEKELQNRITEVSKKIDTNNPDKETLARILSFIDLTTLSGDDTELRVNDLCTKAQSFANSNNMLKNVAAVCVYPIFADLVSNKLKGTGIKTACVAGAFPSGQSPLNIRIAEVKQAVADGADEIDMVISRGKLIEGNEEYVANEVAETKKACGKAHLKVILETGELKTIELVRKASILAINNGGNFIKTSTGKISPAATPEAMVVMLDTIKEYYDKTGIKIGIKPAGGISECNEAMLYYSLVKEILGNEWLNNSLFRIGASRLATKVMDQFVK